MTFLQQVNVMQRIREIKSGLYIIACGIVLFFIFTAHEARADTWAVATVTSYHTDRAAHYNERNGGVGIERDVSQDARLIGGFYRNSLDRESLYLGATFTPWHLTDNIHIGVMGGIITGYANEPVPMAAPLIQIEGRYFGANIVAIPATFTTPGVVGLQIKWRFE